MLTRKAAIITIAVVMAIVFIVIYTMANSPNRVIQKYISEQSTTVNPSGSSTNPVAQFNQYVTDHQLPTPTVTFNTIKKTFSSREVQASFAVFTYANDGQLKNIHSGMLSFSLTRDLFRWRLNSVDIINDMQLAQ
ncbi:putative PurR-regulated permease PerM [Paenibacillus amylolyticus]|uniref:PurR-regulated permease PerM n=1 Tax=Paenibacillus amylolyticus TaxID=1451 RepID=A0AAP5H1X3_PAEAM|nr:hypothetical protein [Paenibacillus amylolyticus]MDR6724755.1 putative PurR-regulated permease PerM [Paenibacillus amylolyticus]